MPYGLSPTTLRVDDQEIARPQRFVIYVHINRVNGKKYVGQTRNGLEYRWRDHVARAKTKDDAHGCRAFHAAIRKYGPDAFEHAVLTEAYSHDQANEAEIAWILECNAISPNGYNLSAGGGVGPVHAETCAKLSARGRERWAQASNEAHKQRRAAFMAAMRKFDTEHPDLRRAIALRREAAKTPEVRADIGRKIAAAMSPERRQAVGQRTLARTPEQRSASVRLGRARMTPEQRSAIARKINAANPVKQRTACMNYYASMTPEQRSEKTRKGWITRRANACKKNGAIMVMATMDRLDLLDQRLELRT
jgi:group I intron endonuclease